MRLLPLSGTVEGREVDGLMHVGTDAGVAGDGEEDGEAAEGSNGASVVAPALEHSYLGTTRRLAGGRDVRATAARLPVLVLPPGAGCVFPHASLPVRGSAARAAAERANGSADPALRHLIAVFAAHAPAYGTITEARGIVDNTDAVLLAGVRRCRRLTADEGEALSLGASEASEGASEDGHARQAMCPRGYVDVQPLSDEAAPHGPPPECAAHRSWVYRSADERAAASVAANAALEAGIGGDRADAEKLLAMGPIKLSFWLSSQLPLSDEQRVALLQVGSTTRRLRACTAALQYMRVLRCARCGRACARAAAVFAMDAAGGAQNAFVNAHGAVHDTLTVRDVDATSVMLYGTPSSQDSVRAAGAHGLKQRPFRRCRVSHCSCAIPLAGIICKRSALTLLKHNWLTHSLGIKFGTRCARSGFQGGSGPLRRAHSAVRTWVGDSRPSAVGCARHNSLGCVQARTMRQLRQRLCTTALRRQQLALTHQAIPRARPLSAKKSQLSRTQLAGIDAVALNELIPPV